MAHESEQSDDSFMRAIAAAPIRPLPPRAPDPGTVIAGRFVVRELLGRGGMGVVVLADDRRLARPVALKLSGVDPRGATAARMIREAKSMAKIDDPFVLEVYDVGEHDGTLFIAMEYAPGGSLRQWMAAGPRAWPDVLRMFDMAGRGLEAAHARGLVHRDFKPDNVLVDADGRARVADFGLARRGDASAELDGPTATSLTSTGVALGTPAYMPPEQYAGDDIDARADQFAFCVALWEGLYGERPFAGTSAPQLLLAMSECNLRAVPAGTAVPPAVADVLRRGLAARREDRFASMAVLLGALRRAARPSGSSRVAIGFAIGIAGLGLAGAAAWRFAPSADRSEAERSAGDRASADPSAAEGTWGPSTPPDEAAAVAALLRRAEAARAQRYAGELAASETELRAVIAELRALRGADDESLVWPIAWLAETLSQRGKLVKAHAAWVEAYRIIALHRPFDDPDLQILKREIDFAAADVRWP